MGTIFVICSKAKISNLTHILSNAMDSMQYRNFDSTRVLANNKIGFGCHLTYTTKESKVETLPYFDKETNCYITADARIDYREELSEKLKINWEVGKNYPDSQFILLSYLKWGKSCLRHLYGDFVFVIWDERINQLFCARDQFGSRPLLYFNNREYFVVSSDIQGISSLPGFNLRIRDQYILDSICSIDLANNKTAFQGIKKLQPAHYLIFSTHSGAVSKRYWDLKIDERYSSLTEAESCKELRKRFLDSIVQRSRVNTNIGVELSGGLDSSGILTGIDTTKNSNIKIHAFTHSRPEDCYVKREAYKSELHFSKYIVKKLKNVKHIIVSGNSQYGCYSALVNPLSYLLRPVNQMYPMFSDLLLKEANQSGINVMLSGFGGDEGVTYNGGGYYAELLREGKIREFKKNIKIVSERRGKNFHYQFVKNYMRLRLPWVYSIFKSDWRYQQFNTFAIRNTNGSRFRMRNRYLENTFFPDFPDVRKRQYNRLMLPALVERLENTHYIAQKEGIEYRYPFLDVKLLEFFYSLPSSFKYRNGIGRYLFRESMKGLLPEMIRLRTDKSGITIPNYSCRISNDVLLIRKIINEGQENNHYHYVDYQKLHKILDGNTNESKNNKRKYSPKALFGPLSILILQRWQREGKIDIGIQC